MVHSQRKRVTTGNGEAPKHTALWVITPLGQGLVLGLYKNLHSGNLTGTF